MSIPPDDPDTSPTEESIVDEPIPAEEPRQVLAWSGPQMDGSRALRLSGARYGKYSNEDRALPDIRDGFKPVHRRMIYSMIVDNMLASGPYSKSAAAVGTCMGDYHPHGDSSIYEALVRLAQSFSMNVPLIDGQGNFGTRGPAEFSDPPAAMRYCVTGDTRVSMADGSSVRIGDLAASMPSDSDLDVRLKVLDDRGRSVTASKLFHSGSHPTLRVRTKKGYELSGTENHPVLCLAVVDGHPLLGWKLLGALEPGDRVVLNRSLRELGPDLTAAERLLAHLIGGFVSEGWAQERGGYKGQRAGFNNLDKAYFDEILEAYDAHVGGVRYVSERVIESGSRLYEFDVQDLTALRASCLGSMIGHDSYAKRIPELVWHGSMRFKQAFLRSLFTGDGSSSLLPRNTIQVSYSTYSDRLAGDVQSLLLEFGIVSVRCLSGREHKVVITNRRDARLFAERIGFWGDKHEKLERDLATIPLASRALSSDHVPYIAEYVRNTMTGTYAERSWLVKNNFDRVERWADAQTAVADRIVPESARRVVEPLLRADYYYAEVSSVESAGTRPVFSLRVDTDEHVFLTDGFVSHNTEARLSPVASSFKSDLHPDIVPFVPNFSERKKEPVVLPVTFPVLLVNGVSGIGWGMGVDVPPHNLGEVIDATVLMAEKPDSTLKQVMKRLPAPDFPTDGLIVMPEDGFESIYRTGKGTFILEGKFHVENVRGGQAMVITELPYGVSSQQIKAQVIAGARAEKITEVTELPLDKSNRQGIRIEIRLKRGGTVSKLIEQVRRYTAISTTVKNNFTVLIDGRPTGVGLLDVLTTFVEFRRGIVTRRLEREKAGLLQSLRMLSALRAALDVITKVIEIIRGTNGDDDAVREQLKKIIKVTPYGARKRVAIDDEQAQYIMDMQLKRLSALNQFELDEEIKRKTARVDEIVRILASPAEINAIVVNELREVKKRLATPRRSAIGSASTSAPTGTSASAAPTTDISLYVTASGNCTAVERGRARKEAPLLVGGDDRIVSVVDTDTDAELHVFTRAGTVHRIRAAEIGIDTRRGKGRPIVSLERGDRVAAVLPVVDAERPYLLLVTETGDVKRFDQAILDRSHSGGSPAMSVAGDDRIVTVVPHRDDDDVVLHTAGGKALRLAMKPVRPVKSPSAGGITGMRVAADDRVVDACVADGDVMLVLHAGGHAKLVALADYPLKGRGGGGVESVKTDKPVKEPAGEVSLARALTAKRPVTLVTARGEFIPVVPSAAPAGARGAVASKPWIDVPESDRVSTLLPD